MKRIRRISLGILFALLATVPFAAQAAGTCSWWWCRNYNFYTSLYQTAGGICRN